MIRVNLQDRLNGRAGAPPRWVTWLVMAVSFVVGVALFLLAASLALVLIPIVALAGAIAVWRLKAKLKAAGFGRPPDSYATQRPASDRIEIIDAEYRIIEPGEPPRR